MQLKKINKNLFYAGGDILSLGKKEVDFLSAAVKNTGNGRIRICTHAPANDPLHEMFIAVARRCYIRPAMHMEKSESLHVISGRARAVLFTPSGDVADVINLGDKDSGLPFYYRIGNSILHTLLVESEIFLFHEVTEGPFKPEQTVFPDWAPEEWDREKAQTYLKQLSDKIKER